jgi:uncharacterized protein (UPF0548 family)
MQIYIADQKNNFDRYLKVLMTKPVIAYNREKLIEKITQIHITDARSLDEVNLDFLFGYKIFPENILTSKTQWDMERRTIAVGDTILQQVFLPPLKFSSLKVVFGVRINSIIKEPTRQGFSYETIEGHAEKGISTFTLEQRKDGLFFAVHTFSEPGSWLTKLAGVVFTLPYQAFCTKQALKNVKRQIYLQLRVPKS